MLQIPAFRTLSLAPAKIAFSESVARISIARPTAAQILPSLQRTPYAALRHDHS
jgi:hypothetical protein